VIAHVGGLPVEEIAWPVLSASGIGLLLVRGWFYDSRMSRREPPVLDTTSLRPLAGDDVDAVIELSLRAWVPVFAAFEREWGDALYRRFFPDWRSQQATSVRDACAANPTWVSIDDGTVSGFVNVIFDEDEMAGEIFMIATDPHFQRRGIATRLTGFALDEMRRRGMTVATVATGADDGHAPARRAYERAGFSPIPQVLYAQLL
jgi:ribosomal protein S18 acetylase RimI-like enzyme